MQLKVGERQLGLELQKYVAQLTFLGVGGPRHLHLCQRSSQYGNGKAGDQQTGQTTAVVIFSTKEGLSQVGHQGNGRGLGLLRETLHCRGWIVLVNLSPPDLFSLNPRALLFRGLILLWAFASIVRRLGLDSAGVRFSSWPPSICPGRARLLGAVNAFSSPHLLVSVGLG
jgi:hypothetical protein